MAKEIFTLLYEKVQNSNIHVLEMKELYSSYKQAKNRAIHLKNDPKHLEEYNEICLKRDDMFEQLSKAIYDEFNEKKPDLINKKTNEKVAWNDLFSVPFEKLTKKQKDYMVRLLDAQPYKFKDDSLYNY